MDNEKSPAESVVSTSFRLKTRLLDCGRRVLLGVTAVQSSGEKRSGQSSGHTSADPRQQ